jgi:hypothetical protein
MDPRCCIELLGELRVQQGEQRTITRFRTRQTGALLAYLAYHLGRHLPREVLIEAIWPDVEARTGRRPSAGFHPCRHASQKMPLCHPITQFFRREDVFSLSVEGDWHVHSTFSFVSIGYNRIKER